MRLSVATITLCVLLGDAVATSALAAPITLRLTVPNAMGTVSAPGGLPQAFTGPVVVFELVGDTSGVVQYEMAAHLPGPIRVTIPGVATGTMPFRDNYVRTRDLESSGYVEFVSWTPSRLFVTYVAQGSAPALLGFRFDHSLGPMAVDSQVYWSSNYRGGGTHISFVADDGSNVVLTAGGQGTLSAHMGYSEIPTTAPAALVALVALMGVAGIAAVRMRERSPPGN